MTGGWAFCLGRCGLNPCKPILPQVIISFPRRSEGRAKKTSDHIVRLKVIHSHGGWGSRVVEVPFSKDRLDIMFTSPGPAVQMSDSDPRMGKFMIRNPEVISN
jgi:hypothetical protein